MVSPQLVKRHWVVFCNGGSREEKGGISRNEDGVPPDSAPDFALPIGLRNLLFQKTFPNLSLLSNSLREAQHLIAQLIKNSREDIIF